MEGGRAAIRREEKDRGRGRDDGREGGWWMKGGGGR